MITLRVVGEPAPQGSKARGRNGGLYEMSTKKLKPWRAAIQAALLARHAEMVPGAVHVEITFILPRPAGHYGTGRNRNLVRDSAPRQPVTRPDLDKLTRAVLDALASGRAYADDGRVTSMGVAKRYAKLGEEPGAFITVQAEEAWEGAGW